VGSKERHKLYDKIETHRARPLLVYVTSKREGVDAQIATDALPYLIDQLDSLPPNADTLDFLIVSYGGDPMVSWRIMSLIRERVKHVAVLIPQSAYSAATLLALGANEIIMHPNAHLGPVDMQITTFAEGKRRHFSTEDISAFLTFVRDELLLTDQEHLRRLFEMTCKEVGTLGVGFTARSSKLAVALGKRLLGMHMEDDDHSNKKKALVESLSRQFHSHAYPVSRTEALDMNLAVNKDRDTALENLMWEVWLDLEDELQERRPFSPITELMNSPQAGTLLAPVPQLALPINAPGPTNFSADIPGVQAVAQGSMVEPVDFAFVTAIMESARLAHRASVKGKILSSRLPDLNLQLNCLTSFHGWETVSP
jgi:hypothetical protein